jgi:hypothetical protein
MEREASRYFNQSALGNATSSMIVQGYKDHLVPCGISGCICSATTASTKQPAKPFYHHTLQTHVNNHQNLSFSDTLVMTS